MTRARWCQHRVGQHKQSDNINTTLCLAGQGPGGAGLASTPWWIHRPSGVNGGQAYDARKLGGGARYAADGDSEGETGVFHRGHRKEGWRGFAAFGEKGKGGEVLQLSAKKGLIPAHPVRMPWLTNAHYVGTLA